MRSPLVIAGPGIPKGQRSDAMCYLLDIFPTLGELTGVPAPTGSEGRSLVPNLTDPARPGRDSIFTAYADVQRAVRDDRFKLIVYPRVNKTQLFDLKRDPIEMNDLANDKNRALDVARLTGLLKRWQENLDDWLPLRSQRPEPLEFDFSTLQAPEPQAGSAPAKRDEPPGALSPEPSCLDALPK
jgi:arylsulfatase A-like enzyme